MFTVVKVSGKQYTVVPGQKITVDRLTDAVGSTVSLVNLIGEPVNATVSAHILGEKQTSRRFRNKTRYNHVIGHRQHQTVLEITAVSAKASG